MATVRIFGEGEAQHYCNGYSGRMVSAKQSLDDLLSNYRSRPIHRLIENKAEFEDYRDCSLRDVERRLFLCVSNLRRSHDLMHTSAAPWALVTLYYASFFAASALLGIFGCHVGGTFIVDVSKSSPGSQELLISSQAMKTLGISRKGSHERFWHIFYECSPSVDAFVTNSSLTTALHLVQQNKTWQIQARNRINYDPYRSFDLMLGFQTTFNSSHFPSCLQGELQTQLWVAVNMSKLAFDFANRMKLSTDALNNLAVPGTRGDKIDHLVLQSSLPSVSRTVDWKKFL